jgi:hypothetical protein
MISEMIMLSIFWLNAFPHRLGISQTMSPRNIVTGLDVDYNKHCRIEFGQYVQTHEKHDNSMTTRTVGGLALRPTGNQQEHCRIEFGQYVQTHEKHDNSMTTRTVGALALRPTGNQQGGYCFYSLSTGRRLHRTHWTELPMPDEVKDRVHALARRARASRGLTFTDSDGIDLDELYPDENNTNDDASDDDDSDDSTYDPNGVDNNNDSDNESNDSDDSDSDDDSDYAPPGDSDDEKSTDSYDFPGATPPNQPLPTPTSVELGGVNNTGNDNSRNVGVATEITRNVGVATKITETNENDNTDLEAYVNELETELDNEIAEVDSDYNQQDSEESDDETDGAFERMEEDEADKLRANATGNKPATTQKCQHYTTGETTMMIPTTTPMMNQTTTRLKSLSVGCAVNERRITNT